jgi:hypothetical protein
MRQTCGTEESRGKPKLPEGRECVKDMACSESCSAYGAPLYFLPRIEPRRAFHVFSLMDSTLSRRAVVRGIHNSDVMNLCGSYMHACMTAMDHLVSCW